MTRHRSAISITAVLLAFALGGCESFDDVRIVRDAPTAGRVGQPYAHVFTTSRPVEGPWFIPCRSDESIRVERNGQVAFTPTSAGLRGFCVELRTEDGMIDRYDVAVRVAPPPGESPAELNAVISAFLTKLDVVRLAAEGIARPKQQSCPDSLATASPEELKVHAYGLEYAAARIQGQKLSQAASESSFFRPPSSKLLTPETRATGPSPGQVAEVRRLTGVRYVAFVKADRRVMPQARPGNAFDAGEFSGWVLVGDVQAGSILCQAPFSFRSSTAITWTETVPEEQMQAAYELGVDSATARTQLDIDFSKNGLAALREALGKIGPQLQLE